MLEQIVGSVEDEFDTAPLKIESEGPGKFRVPGGTALNTVNKKLKLELESIEVETLFGLLKERIVQLFRKSDPEYAPWMITVTYKVE